MRFPISILILLLLLGEVAVFILVGEAIGIGATLALVLLSMVAGILLLRRQGVAVLARIRSEAAAGRAPAKPLIEAAVIAVAAILMIVPGFITDVAGVLLFVPPVRSSIWRRIRRRVEANIAGRAGFRPAPQPVYELDQSQYAVTPHPDSPWRRDGGSTS